MPSFILKLHYNITKFLTVEIRKSLSNHWYYQYLTIVTPCTVVFSNVHKMQYKKYKTRARFCYIVPKRAHVTPFLNANDVLKMSYRRLLNMACLVQKIVYTRSPKYIVSKLNWFRDDRSTITRSKNTKLLSIPRYTTTSSRGC